MPDEGRRRVAKVVGATGEALGMVAFIEGRAGARVGRAAELVSATVKDSLPERSDHRVFAVRHED